MEATEERMAQVMKEVFVRKGYDDLASKILAILFLEPKEISMDELASKTGYSLPSISLKIKLLTGSLSAALTKTTKPGSKKTYVFMEKSDIENRFMETAKNGYESITRFAKENLPKLISEYKNKPTTPEKKKRIKIMENYLKALDESDEIIACMAKKISEIRNRRQTE
ncbi:hypothetical protein JXA85_01205 [Candidatus Woesearchaeota archaeon]|nr:hypothetical protein [Candidatus Woesearchaeota archaeon]